MEVINIKYIKLYVLCEVIYFSYFLEVINMKILKKIVLSLLLAAGISNVNLNSMIVNGFLSGTNLSQAVVEAAGFRVDTANRVHSANGQFASGVNIQGSVPNEQNDVAVLNAANDAIQIAVNGYLTIRFNEFNQHMNDINDALNANMVNIYYLIDQITLLRSEFNKFSDLININMQEIIAVYEECNNRLNIAENQIREILIQQGILLRNRPELSTREHLADRFFDMVENSSLTAVPVASFLGAKNRAFEQIQSINSWTANGGIRNTLNSIVKLRNSEEVQNVIDHINNYGRRYGIGIEAVTVGYSVLRLTIALSRYVNPYEQIAEFLASCGIVGYEIIEIIKN